MLTKEAILESQDLPRELVNVPEWGGSVWIRCLTAAERDAFEASMLNTESKGAIRMANVRAKLVCRAACNEDGSRIFLDADADKLGRKSAAAMDRLFSVAQRLSGMSAKDVEELEKNSDSGLAEDSHSASPQN